MSQKMSQTRDQSSHHPRSPLSRLNQLGLRIAGLAIVIFCLFGGATIAFASPSVPITVYRSPTCSCCGRWMEHLQAQGFQVSEVEKADMEPIKQNYGVPADLESCHTAIVDGYVIEGHVPASDIQQLLAAQPDVTGIAAPGMPVGSPGMESGDRHDPFSVFWFHDGSVDVFSEHSAID